MLWDTITFGAQVCFYYLDLVKGKPGYMKFVPPTVRRLQRNLAQVAQTKPILPLLREHFEAML
jgi:hypothetical protein